MVCEFSCLRGKKLCEKRDYEQAAYVYNIDFFGSFPGEFVASYVLPESIGEITEDDRL